MFKAGNFSFPPEIHQEGAPTCNDPDPHNLSYDNPYPTRANSLAEQSTQASDSLSIPSPNLSPALPPSLSSSETSTAPAQATTSPSHTRLSLLSSTGLQTPTMTQTMCRPSPLFNALPPGLQAAKEMHSHVCNLFCDADAVGLSSTRFCPIT